MTTSGPDTDLFALFAHAETRLVLETLLREPLKQSKLADEIGVDTRTLGVAIRKLEVAGLVVRSSQRGKVGLTHFDATAGLLETEASLSKEIQERKAAKAARRSRDLRKSRMQGGAEASRLTKGEGSTAK